MEVSDLILADYATVNERGKFTLVGAGFTEIATKKLPCTHPLMFILIRLKIAKEDVGKNRLDMKIVGERGVMFSAEVNVNIPKTHGGKKYIPLTNRIANLKLEEAGVCCIEIRVNGQLKRSQDLNVRLIKT